MPQHFLLSRPAKTLSLAQVFRMSDADAETMFRKIRWIETDGAPVCPNCGALNAYECRRSNGSLRFRCRGCKKDFTITSGTLFASHKLREAMAEEMKGRVVGGEGKVAEVDGGYFGGYIKPANQRENRRDRRLGRNQNGKRKVVVIIRERNGNSVPAVFKSEAAALSFISHRVAKGTVINADEASSWDGLHQRYEMRRINHEDAYSFDGACTNWAEEFFSRMRRAEIGHHHHVAGVYLLRYAQEATWREDNRRMSNGDQVGRLTGYALSRKPSVDFAGYWQRKNA